MPPEPARSELAELQRAADGKSDASVFPINKERASRLMSELMDSLDLMGVSLHTLRHSFTSCAARAGIPPFHVKEILGHADMYVTAYYLHRGGEDLTREAKQGKRIIGSCSH